MAEPKCTIYSESWNRFTEGWFRKIHAFLEESLGQFIGKLSGNIKPLPKKNLELGHNALYDPMTGDMFLREEAEGNISYLLGNLLHEMTHANLGDLYDQTFYREGFVDYLDEVLTDNNFWGEFRSVMHDGYVFSNKHREEEAKKEPTQFNVDRWNGQQWARTNLGTNIVEAIKQAKKKYLMERSRKRNAALKVIQRYLVGDVADLCRTASKLPRIDKLENLQLLPDDEYYGFYNPSTKEVRYVHHRSPLPKKPEGSWFQWHSHQRGEKGTPSIIDLFDCYFNKDTSPRYVSGVDGLTKYRMVDKGKTDSMWADISKKLDIKDMRGLMNAYAADPLSLYALVRKPEKLGFEVLHEII